MRRLSIAVLTAVLLSVAVSAVPVAAGSGAKVVVVVGPVGDHNAHYKSDANDVVAEARRYTSNVVKLYTPNATWAAVKAAAQGASVFVYLGHGNGWPSIYPPFQTLTKDGLGLDPNSGADGSKHVYYGEDYIRDNIRFAPNAVVLLFHLCYASGNTEPGLSQGTYAEARERVDNYGAGFIGAGARAVIAEGHPAHPVTNTIRQLFTTNRTLDAVFRAGPTWHGHLKGPFASQRTPGLRFEMDADTAAPSGFYRSIVGDLDLRAGTVVGPSPAPTGAYPADFVVPGAAEVVDQDGTGLFAHASGAQDPGNAAPTTLPGRDAAPADRGGRPDAGRHPRLRRPRSSARRRAGSSGRAACRRATRRPRACGPSTAAAPCCRPTATGRTTPWSWRRGCRRRRPSRSPSATRPTRWSRPCPRRATSSGSRGTSTTTAGRPRARRVVQLDLPGTGRVGQPRGDRERDVRRRRHAAGVEGSGVVDGRARRLDRVAGQGGAERDRRAVGRPVDRVSPQRRRGEDLRGRA